MKNFHSRNLRQRRKDWDAEKSPDATPPKETLELCKQALASLALRKDEDVNEWAEKLARAVVPGAAAPPSDAAQPVLSGGDLEAIRLAVRWYTEWEIWEQDCASITPQQTERFRRNWRELDEKLKAVLSAHHEDAPRPDNESECTTVAGGSRPAQAEDAPEGPWGMRRNAHMWVVDEAEFREGRFDTCNKANAIIVRNALNRDVRDKGADKRCEKCGAKREESTLYIQETATGEGAYMLKPCKCDSPEGDKAGG